MTKDCAAEELVRLTGEGAFETLISITGLLLHKYLHGA
tara:strand:+ start:339 stop:452 length:114 start_codon:yes stop_codon:yes gene_type:complete